MLERWPERLDVQRMERGAPVRVEVYGVVWRNGMPIATVELRVPVEDAAAWMALGGKSVEIALGAVETLRPPSPTARPKKPQSQAQAAVQRSRGKAAQAQKDAEAEGKRKRKAKRKRTRAKKKAAAPPKAVPTSWSNRIEDLRRQIPEGWLLVSDFAAEVSRAKATVRQWAKSGKIAGKHVQQMPVKGFKQARVTVIRESIASRMRKGKPGKGGSTLPVQALIDRVGLIEACSRTGVSRSVLSEAYSDPKTLPEEHRAAVLDTLSAVLELEERRGVAREDDDERPDTAGDDGIPMYGDKALGADDAAWGSKVAQKP